MATTAIQNKVTDIGFVRSVAYNVLTDGTADINQGSLVYLDTSNHVIKEVVDNTSALVLVGVASDTSYKNLYGTKDYQTGQLTVYTSGIFFFKTTAGDTYHEGDQLYIGADAQTVTNTVGGLTAKIGIVKLRPGQAAFASTTTNFVDMIVTPIFPANAGL